MSEHDPHEHTSFIKTPKQLLVVVVLAFVVPIVLIAMLASLASRGALLAALLVDLAAQAREPASGNVDAPA